MDPGEGKKEEGVLPSCLTTALVCPHIGPLCTAEACEMADKERARLTAQHNANEAARKKLQQAEEALKKDQKEREAEASWKAKEAAEDFMRDKELQEELKEAQLKS